MSGRRERARARGRRRRRRLAVAHVISVAVHLLPLVALVGLEWPDLDAEPEVPMRRVVEVRLEQRRPPKDVMFQAEHDSDVERATTAVASGTARRTQGGAVGEAGASRHVRKAAPAAGRRLAHLRPAPSRRRAATARLARAVARRVDPRAERPAEARLASARVSAQERSLALAQAAAEAPPAAAAARMPQAAPPGHAGTDPDVELADARVPVPPRPYVPSSPAAVAPSQRAAGVTAMRAQAPDQRAQAAPAAQIPDLRHALRTQVPARAMLLAAYLKRIQDRIRQEWHPKLVLHGAGTVWRPVEVRVYMAVAADGTLQAVRVAQSCGNPRIDGQALAAVKRAQPFLPPPSALLHAGVVGFTFGAMALGPGGPGP